MDGVIPEVFTKIVQVFEKAIDEKVSGLKYDDRIEIARIYMEYMNENC